MTDTLAQLITGALLLIVAAGSFALGYRAGRRSTLVDPPEPPERQAPGPQRPPRPPTRIH